MGNRADSSLHQVGPERFDLLASAIAGRPVAVAAAETGGPAWTDGTTVFGSSHLLAEVEQICTHVGVMRTGRLVFQGSLPELRRTGAARVTVQTADPEAAAKVLTGLGLADAQVTTAEGHPQPEASAVLGDAPPERVCAELVQAGIGVRGFAVTAPSLEDLFVGLTGEGFDVSG